MILRRVLTALCLIPLVLWGVLRLEHLYFNILTVIISSLAAFEWANLCQYSSRWGKCLYVFAFVFTLLVEIWLNSFAILFVGCLFWLLALYLVCSYRGVSVSCWLKARMGKALIGLLVLSVAAFSLMALHQGHYGPLWVILLFFLIWSTDTFAFFVGKKWGHKPLAPFVSPKKTWAGFWGGMLGALLIAFLLEVLVYQYFVYLHQPVPALLEPIYVLWWLGLALGVILFAVIGDLFESLVKRISGVKDSGKLIPGHGGILDRCDSLLAALPFYTLCVLLFFD